MKHQPPTTGTSALDIEAALDKVAVCIKVLGPSEGWALLPIYARLERELAAIRMEEDAMSKVLARLSRMAR